MCIRDRRYLHGVSVAFQLGCAEDVPHQCKEEVGIVLYEMAEILPFLLGKVRDVYKRQPYWQNVR